MSGEGLICARRELAQDCEGEVLADVLAYLAQRRDNCALVSRRVPGLEPLAADRRQQLDVIIGDLAARLHEGSAAVRAELAK
jgi:hypothetical protein